MHFPTAKFIDIIWDIVVGRGGQAILGWITYKISSQYLTLAMHEAAVPYSTYEALAFMPPTLTRTIRLMRDLLLNRGRKARLIILWIVLSSLFVISFSSFATAMSGYSSNTYAIMQSYQGELVPWQDFEAVQFVIVDAWRVCEPGPVTITLGSTCLADGFLKDDEEEDETQDHDDDGDGDDEDDDPWEYVPSNCSMFWRTVQCMQSVLICQWFTKIINRCK